MQQTITGRRRRLYRREVLTCLHRFCQDAPAGLGRDSIPISKAVFKGFIDRVGVFKLKPKLSGSTVYFRGSAAVAHHFDGKWRNSIV